MPTLGVYASTDGGASFSLVLPGTANEVKFDPNDSNTVYATIASSATGRPPPLARRAVQSARGRRSSRRTAAASRSLRWRCRTARRASTSATRTAGGQGAQVYRVDDASQPAATLTASNNAAWTRLSNSTDGTPGFAVYNYCVSAFGGQCSYDMSIMSPPDRPDMVVVAGLMHYEELGPYEFQVAPGRRPALERSRGARVDRLPAPRGTT